MLTYQIRPRLFRHGPGERFVFPADCAVRMHFLPKQPFGMEAGGGRTAVRNKPASVLFNMNSGAHWIESAEPLAPLDVSIDGRTGRLTLKGNVLEISGHFSSLKDFEELILGHYFALPILLNVDFADPPIVERVDGNVAGVSFRWELREWRFANDITDQVTQQGRIVTAWERRGLVAGLTNRRLLAALHYFHVAVRLSRVGATPGEFLAEAILNLAKTLEVLFPPAGDGQTRDAARRGLRELGFDDQRIEADYLPAMSLRNEIDVGHVDLSLFTPTDLSHIHAYTERAEPAFRLLLQTALTAVAADRWTPPPYEKHELSASTREVLMRLAKHGADAA